MRHAVLGSRIKDDVVLRDEDDYVSGTGTCAVLSTLERTTLACPTIGLYL